MALCVSYGNVLMWNPFWSRFQRFVIAARKPRRDSTNLEHGRDCLEAPERELFGHPRGLAVLFATETWERFSYFGNSALVVLYMVQHLLQPGRIEGVLGFAAVKAGLEFLFGPLA